MNVREIEYLSSKFRSGIEKAYEYRMFTQQPFSNFPNGCCGDAPDLLAQYLIDNSQGRNIQCKYVYGTYEYDQFDNKFGHAWLVVNDSIIVDITADQRQFKNKRIFPQDVIGPCFVGKKSEFHSLFEIDIYQCRKIYGLQYLGENAYTRLKTLYEVILDHIL